MFIILLACFKKFDLAHNAFNVELHEANTFQISFGEIKEIRASDAVLIEQLAIDA